MDEELTIQIVAYCR